MGTGWLTFVVLGLLASALVWLLQRRRWPFWLRLPAAAFALAALAIAMFVAGENTFLGEVAWYDETPAREVILFLLMLAGMAARSLSVAIEERRQEAMKLGTAGQPVASVPLRIDVWELFYPMLFSVITFGALLSQVGDGTLNVAAVVLAFQTGFFWQTVIKEHGPRE